MDRRTKARLLDRLRHDADLICARFGLRYASIEAERANVKRRYGICYADGTIKIRLRHASTGRPLKYSSLVSTLCHELAHLRHFDHSPRFHDFYQQLLRWSRRQGIYAPARRRVSGVGEAAIATPQAIDVTPGRDAEARPVVTPRRRPEQLTLF